MTGTCGDGAAHPHVDWSDRDTVSLGLFLTRTQSITTTFPVLLAPDYSGTSDPETR